MTAPLLSSSCHAPDRAGSTAAHARSAAVSAESASFSSAGGRAAKPDGRLGRRAASRRMSSARWLRAMSRTTKRRTCRPARSRRASPTVSTLGRIVLSIADSPACCWTAERRARSVAACRANAALR
eukprot:1231769-Prymnesium_polylepis.1